MISIKVSNEILPSWQDAADRESKTLGEWLRAAAELALARGSTR